MKRATEWRAGGCTQNQALLALRLLDSEHDPLQALVEAEVLPPSHVIAIEAHTFHGDQCTAPHWIRRCSQAHDELVLDVYNTGK